MGKRFTIKQLAEVSEFSVSTVSKALSNSSEISEATKDKIRKLAKKFKYQPSKIAQSFKSGRSQTIGLILPYEFDPSVFEFVKKLEEKFNQIGMSFLLVFCNYNKKAIDKKLTLLANSTFINQFLMLDLKNEQAMLIEQLTQKWPNLSFINPENSHFDTDYNISQHFLKNVQKSKKSFTLKH